MAVGPSRECVCGCLSVQHSNLSPRKCRLCDCQSFRLQPKGESMFQIDKTQHAAESDLRGMVGTAAGNTSVVDEARKLGISWVTILALLAQYGPQFVQVLMAIIAALKTPAPTPAP